MEIEVVNGNVIIEEKSVLFYDNIRDMLDSDNGKCLQLCKELENRGDEIDAILSDIADNIYRLEDILSSVRRQEGA